MKDKNKTKKSCNRIPILYIISSIGRYLLLLIVNNAKCKQKLPILSVYAYRFPEAQTVISERAHIIKNVL